MYVPVNVNVYCAAYAGAFSGLAVSGRQLQNESPTSSNYVFLAAVAGAFAQAVDVAWGATAISQLVLDALNASSEATFQNRTSSASDLNSLLQSNWTNLAESIVASVTAEVTYVTGQGITPPVVITPATANAYTTTSGALTVPAVGATATVDVVSSEFMAVGETVYITGAGWFQVTAKPTATSVTLLNLGYTSSGSVVGNVPPATVVTSGKAVTPSGVAGSQAGLITQGDWYIDPVAGNDITGTGAIGAPLKTLKEVSDRLRGKFVTAADLIIRVLSNTIADDTMNLDVTLNTGTGFQLLGTLDVNRSSTVTAFTDADRDHTPVQMTVQDGAVDWTTELYTTGQRVKLTSGDLSQWWMSKNVGAGVGNLSQPVIDVDNGPGTPAPGDTFDVVANPQISIQSMRIVSPSGSVESIAITNITLLSTVTESTFYLQSENVKWSECCFLGNVVLGNLAGVATKPVYQNCAFVGTCTSRFAQIVGGILNAFNGVGETQFDFEPLFLKTLTCKSGGVTAIDSGAFFPTPAAGSGSAIVIEPLGLFDCNGGIITNQQLYGIGWTVRGVEIKTFGRFVYDGTGNNFQVTGTAGDLIIGGLASIPLMNQTTFALGAATATTWVNFTGAFGGNILNVAKAASINLRA